MIQPFDLGQVVITQNALDLVDPVCAVIALRRHEQGDWGELDEEDRASNDRALRVGLRLLSAYRDVEETRFWIITEADRSSTTILLPSDY